jgi:hypothetical protein
MDDERQQVQASLRPQKSCGDGHALVMLAVMPTIDEIWRLAREDAGFSLDEVSVYILPGPKRGGYWAMYFKPRDWLVVDEDSHLAHDNCRTPMERR